MELKLNIVMDNDAFAEEPASEAARLLREIADLVERGDYHGIVRDLNGNKVGLFHIGEVV